MLFKSDININPKVHGIKKDKAKTLEEVHNSEIFASVIKWHCRRSRLMHRSGFMYNKYTPDYDHQKIETQKNKTYYTSF